METLDICHHFIFKPPSLISVFILLGAPMKLTMPSLVSTTQPPMFVTQYVNQIVLESQHPTKFRLIVLTNHGKQ